MTICSGNQVKAETF